MRQAGVRTLYDSSAWGTIGIWESLKLVPRLLRVKAAVAQRFRADAPDLLVLVDFGAFNFRLARTVRGLPRRIVYYFPPGSWKRRPASPEFAALTDLVITPFPWSGDSLRAAGANAIFLGHPLLDTLAPPEAGEELLKQLGMASGGPVFALLPGSRRQELKALLPPLLGAADRILEQEPEAHFLLAMAPNVTPEMVARLSGRPSVPLVGGREALPLSGGHQCALVPGATSQCLAAADVVLSCSGTATLEAALMGKPLALFYRVQGPAILEGLLRRHSFRTIGLPNLIAGRRICPELIQTEVNPERLASEGLDLLRNQARREQMIRDFTELRSLLGKPGGSLRAAEQIVALMRGARGTPASQ
jgi:lipid-A-disaccharide synthase